LGADRAEQARGMWRGKAPLREEARERTQPRLPSQATTCARSGVSRPSTVARPLRRSAIGSGREFALSMRSAHRPRPDRVHRRPRLLISERWSGDPGAGLNACGALKRREGRGGGSRYPPLDPTRSLEGLGSRAHAQSPRHRDERRPGSGLRRCGRSIRKRTLWQRARRGRVRALSIWSNRSARAGRAWCTPTFSECKPRKRAVARVGDNLDGLRQGVHQPLPIDWLAGCVLDLPGRATAHHGCVAGTAQARSLAVNRHLKHQILLG
jgi:hypothetical protein